MPIKFYCKHCGQRLSVASKKAGKKVACPACQGRITIPTESEARRTEKTAEPEESPPKKSPASTNKKKPTKKAPPTEPMLDADQNQFLEELDDLGPLGESWDELLDGDWESAVAEESDRPAAEEPPPAPESTPERKQKPEPEPVSEKASPKPKPEPKPAETKPEPKPEVETKLEPEPALVSEPEPEPEPAEEPAPPVEASTVTPSEPESELETEEAAAFLEDLDAESLLEEIEESPEPALESKQEEVPPSEEAAELTPPPTPVPAPRFVFEEEEEDEDDEDEGFSIRSAESEFEEMDLTPMVDVTFLLLIFFMITASFSLQKSIEVPPPNPDEDGVSQSLQTLDDFREESIIVEIDSNNGIYVDDTKLSSPSEIVQAILDRRDEGGKPKSELVLSAHKAARHETVVAVVDAANEVGMQKIRLASYKGPDD
ncbi:biopolymer transport protein ExbD [Gimesia panareensis]|uniref:Biopolymer transport protein ExbD n=1 Tax=Gimesia panareensis TaxID=2527978 RepID=A0A517Q8N3_9PLAN|nr:biopolymer transport protein ExbD [Gimesia panareensis]